MVLHPPVLGLDRWNVMFISDDRETEPLKVPHVLQAPPSWNVPLNRKNC